MSHRQRSDTCRKPGTAFTAEYKAPGTDVRTSVRKCNIVMQSEFQGSDKKLINKLLTVLE
eukprot:4247153-Amphidinium_carterae.1